MINMKPVYIANGFDFGGKYFVTDQGDIYSSINNRGNLIPLKLLKGWVDNGGYWRVHIVDINRQHRDMMKHVLVLAAHVGDRPSGMVARHLNDDKNDNRIENLQWGTQKENVQDSYVNKKVNKPSGEKHCRARFTWKDIEEIRKAYDQGDLTVQQLANQFAVSNGAVYGVVHRKTWKVPNG